ncbi:MAB_1171c family putative transporter [Actinophytocola sp.]|uniref:MAB_1171c family putative transporter n=1 Tax=Actinophytocola sp. TaxID=1872138 RepID=UPI00389AA267
MTTPSLPYVLVAVVLLVGLTQRLYGLAHHPRDPLRRVVCVFLAGMLAATVAQIFSDAIDRGSGVPRLGAALSDAGAMVAACTGRLFLLYVNHDGPEARARSPRRYAGLAAALGAAALLFLAVPPKADQHTPLYFAVYIWYVGITMVSTCSLCVRYARRTDLPYLRAGLWLLVAGTWSGLAFLAVQSVLLVGERTGAVDAAAVDAAAGDLELLTQALLLAGVGLPSWGPALGDRVRWFVDYRSYRRLRPLWLALRDVEPGFALLPPDRAARRWPRDVGLLLYRQVIEIRDAQLALRPYVGADVPANAEDLATRAGLSTEDVQATAEAAAIAAGIAAKTRGSVPAEPGGVVGTAPGGVSLTEEVAWLRRVAHAFTTSPIVAAYTGPGPV